MKKKWLLLCLLSSFMISGYNCKKTTGNNGCYKGRLEIKGICMNYTIKLLKGAIDANLIEANWKDENTGKEYQNVFGLGSVCSFPANLKQGDEFYFTIQNNPDGAGCVVCQAYYPTPPKKLSISVINTPCN